MKRIEYAAAERGYESEAEWFLVRGTAEFEVKLNTAAGLDSYLIERTVAVSEWRPANARMTAAPTGPADGRESRPCPKCGQMCHYDGWGLVHGNGLGIGSCAAPTGPEPRADAADGTFWTDLRADLADPKFCEAYVAESERIAACDEQAHRDAAVRR